LFISPTPAFTNLKKPDTGSSVEYRRYVGIIYVKRRHHVASAGRANSYSLAVFLFKPVAGFDVVPHRQSPALAGLKEKTAHVSGERGGSGT
jgi:hypothetical protein